ncbi:twin-arginine translocase TatA/TatE family subunit [Conexibacter woesei]|jgi:sec-independent protein translocase protein TatA|uniref:twin-arginine translocase TatA/TatE family subunit n=1 Tax=Conexibacter woesei TaxID=191495 RepID=UPI00040D1FA6
MPSVGFPELIVILVIALIVLGPKKLPEAGKAMGKGMREFKDSLSGMTDHDDDDRPAIRSEVPAPQAQAHRFDPITGEPLTADARRERDAAAVE